MLLQTNELLQVGRGRVAGRSHIDIVKNNSTKIHLVMLAYYMWEEVPGGEFIPC
jgi:hypothetical protein